MPRHKLTDAFVRDLPAPSSRTEYQDAVIPNLRLVAQPTGAKSWALRYGASSKKVTLGRFPVITTSTARKLASETLRRMVDGEPVATRRAPTVADLTATFLERHGPNLAPRTREGYSQMIRDYIVPRLGDVRADRLDRRTVADFVADLVEEDGLGVRANRVATLLNGVLNFGVENGFIETNRIGRLKPSVREAPRQHLITDAELGAIVRALGALSAPLSGWALTLVYTACRRDEVSTMRWLDVDLPGATWTLPAASTKTRRTRTIHLPAPLLAAVDRAPRFAGTDYCFSTNGRSRISGYSAIKRAVDKQIVAEGKVNVRVWTWHDFRRCFSTWAARSGIPLHIAELCLGHADGALGGVVGTYNVHRYGDEMREARERWAAHVDAQAAGNVVPLRRTA